MTDDNFWRADLPKRTLTPLEWCQLCSDLRYVTGVPNNITRIAVVIEDDDHSRITYEHDESQNRELE